MYLDTGPWVAYLSRRDRQHGWARRALGELPVPLLTCEPVVAETCFLLGNHRASALAMLEAGAIRLAFDLQDELVPTRRLVEKYSDVPMALADACLVRMAELERGLVVTLDEDFLVYRTHGRRRLDVVAPFTAPE